MAPFYNFLLVLISYFCSFIIHVIGINSIYKVRCISLEEKKFSNFDVFDYINLLDVIDSYLHKFP